MQLQAHGIEGSRFFWEPFYLSARIYQKSPLQAKETLGSGTSQQKTDESLKLKRTNL